MDGGTGQGEESARENGPIFGAIATFLPYLMISPGLLVFTKDLFAWEPGEKDIDLKNRGSWRKRRDSHLHRDSGQR